MTIQNRKHGWVSLFFHFFFGLSLSLTSSLSAQEVDAEEFVRIPSKSPEEQLKHMHIKPGFRLELVAAEPLVNDPAAMCFDEDKRLYVVELHDHQHLPDPHTSKIKILTDEDGDGRYDKAIVFADKLGWTTAICAWDGGVFIGASPDLIYLKDTTGDGKADMRKTILSGFDRNEKGEISKHYHHERSLNNFNWSPNNRFLCAGGMNGGFVRNAAHPDLTPINLNKLDFSFDPRTLHAQPETGSSQHGMAVDDWGNRFQTKNSDPVQFPTYELRYLLRNPRAVLPAPMASIARPDPKGPVFRRSRTEPWRDARTRLRAAKLEKGPIEKGGSSSGYFTGTADCAVYRGGSFPEDYQGSLFIGEVSENVVHRRKLIFPKDRVEPDALRPEDEADFEFIASSDNWFRPVQIINGPGEALYIADMYRELIEAWHTIPEYIREHLDRDSGNDRGRIWRVVPDTQTATTIPSLEKDTQSLVAALDSSDAWVRDTAARLLYQKQDTAAVPLLEKMLTANPKQLPRTSLKVLYALDGLGALKSKHVTPFLKSTEPWLRIHSLRILEKLKANGADIPVTTLSALASDSDPRVLYQLAFSLGDFPGTDIAESLYQIGKKLPNDESLAQAVASSAGKDGLSALLTHLGKGGDQSSAFATAVFQEAGRMQVALPEGFPNFKDDSENWLGAMLAYGTGLRRGKSSFRKVLGNKPTAELKSKCLAALADKTVSVELREKFLKLLPITSPKENELVSALLPLMSAGIPEELQTAAVRAFQSGARSETAGESIVAMLPKSDAHLRPSMIHLLTRRAAWCKVLLASLKNETLKAMEIPVADVAYLQRHSDKTIAAAAAELLPAPADRGKVIAQFQKSLTLKADPVHGEKIYRERCIVCHRVGKEGGQVGPAMGEYQKHGKGQILLNLLDPNKTVQPDYIAYLLTTNNGEIVMGRVLEDSGAGVKMRDAGGNDHDIARSRIKSLTSTSRSLMPEGIEAGLKPQDVADLLEFIATAKE